MARLAGKVAFITGGGRGIGRATAERFAEEGAKVVIAEIDATSGEAAAQSARARGKNTGGDAHFVHCDIRDKANVVAAVAETVKRFGGLHILHNNAGGSTLQDGPVTTAPEEEFWRVIKLDLFGTFLCSKIDSFRWASFGEDMAAFVRAVKDAVKVDPNAEPPPPAVAETAEVLSNV